MKEVGQWLKRLLTHNINAQYFFTDLFSYTLLVDTLIGDFWVEQESHQFLYAALARLLT